MSEKNVLINVDKAFSALSEKSGMNVAFMEYIADDGVMLRPNSMPFIGKEAVSKLFKDDDSNFTLTWNPLRAELSKSEDMGYTFGVYTFTTESAIQKGTYVSIWKKDQEGNWKFVLDSGNVGIGE